MSSGHDNISNVLLKELYLCPHSPLEYIFNLSIQTGIFPDKIKLAEIIPLYKSKEKNLITNYRPISLLITISKLLEKAVYKRTYHFLDSNYVFFQNQYGFRENRSCKHAISELISHIIKNKELQMTTLAVLLDLSKAFDTLDHTILLKKTRNIWYKRDHLKLVY